MDPALPPDDDLDRLLRPPRRGEALMDLIERVRRLDRRVVGLAVVATVAFVVVIVVLTAPGEPADVSLPRAQAGATGAIGGAAPDGSVSVATSTSAPGPLVVHIAGAVARPGLVTVGAGARTADAIAAAGGASPDADLDRVNLAGPVADGSRIYVPAAGQTDVPAAVAASPGSTPAGGDGLAASLAPVDLNGATAEQLETLPGVGPATAMAILAYRTANGPFPSVDALDEVRGIGPAKLEQLRDLVVAG